MKGRLEHELRTINNINTILENGIPELRTYYLTIQVSKEPLTCLEYIRKISSFLKFINKDIRDISSEDISLYFSSINYKINNNKETIKTSSSYKQTIWSALNSFFFYLQKKGEIEKNPMDIIERPKNTDKVKRISLTMEELNSILDCIINYYNNPGISEKQKQWKERDFLILYLFMNTGMRKTALSEINISDINFNNDTLTIIDKRNKEQIYIITPQIKEAIINWINKRSIILDNKVEDALFISSRGRRISERAIYNIVKKYSQLSLGFSISPHKLRASFVSLFYEASGHDIKATCQAVGHASIETTSLYIVKNNNPRKEAINYMSLHLRNKE